MLHSNQGSGCLQRFGVSAHGVVNALSVKEPQWTKMLDLCLSHASVMWYGGKVPNIVLCLMTISAVRVHGVSRVTHSTSFPDTCFPRVSNRATFVVVGFCAICSSPLIAARGKYVTMLNLPQARLLQHSRHLQRKLIIQITIQQSSHVKVWIDKHGETRSLLIHQKSCYTKQPKSQNQIKIRITNRYGETRIQTYQNG